MTQKSIRREVVQQALRTLDEFVYTKQVSNHPAMVAGHPGLAQQRNYHSWVGSFLSQQCDDVQRIPGKSTRDGELWRNLLSGSGTPIRAADVPHENVANSAADGGCELGPQCTSDQPFTARMRMHQSWYRAHVLQLPYGTGPTENSPKSYGNMLRHEDAARGLNFMTPQIYQAARRRVEQRAGVVEEFRLMHNMLSSQPLCFNLFAPLADLELATQLLRALPGLSAHRALRVELEFTPDARTQYLDDGTAFDAYIEYEQTDGRRAFLGVEVKLTEPFSQEKAYDSPSYRRWMTGDRSPWRQDAAEQTAKLQHNQLWRDHLLAVAHRDQPGSPFANGRLMLVRHPEDRSCERIVTAYSKLLREGDDTLIDMPLDRLFTLWRTAASTEAQRSWLAALQERYVDLEKSQQLWAASGAGR